MTMLIVNKRLITSIRRNELNLIAYPSRRRVRLD